MSVLLSIKPKYVKEIEQGSKQYEFRNDRANQSGKANGFAHISAAL